MNIFCPSCRGRGTNYEKVRTASSSLLLFSYGLIFIHSAALVGKLEKQPPVNGKVKQDMIIMYVGLNKIKDGGTEACQYRSPPCA